MTGRRRVKLARHIRGVAGVVVLGSIAGVAVLAPLLFPNDPEQINLVGRLKPPAWLDGGSSAFLLGTDALGRDVLARIAFGGRISLVIGVSSVVFSGLIGTMLGLAAGYAGGWADHLIGRVVDIQMAFPFMLLAITIAAFLGSDTRNLIFVLAVATWVLYCRLVRVRTLALKGSEFVEAARVTGCGPLRIVLRHILPNVAPVLVVVATFQLPNLIVAESALSFLGLGVPPPTPSWGGIISDGRAYLDSAWWISTFPGLVLVITVIAIGSIGDWLQELLDPRLRAA